MSRQVTLEQLRNCSLSSSGEYISFLLSIGEVVQSVQPKYERLVYDSDSKYWLSSNISKGCIFTLDYLKENFIDLVSKKELKEFPKSGYTQTKEFGPIINYLKNKGLITTSVFNSSSVKGVAWNASSYWSIINASSYTEYQYKDLEKFLEKTEAWPINDFRNTKIWVNNDPQLAKLVYGRLVYYGANAGVYCGGNCIDKHQAWLFVRENGDIDGYDSLPHRGKGDWQISQDSKYREITLKHLGLESYNQGIPVTTNGKSKQDLIDKIIKISDNQDDFRRLQTELFSLGFEWSSGKKSHQPYPVSYKYISLNSNNYINYTSKPYNLDIYDVIHKKPEPKLDLTNTKIWIGDNPELNKKVLQKLFDSGCEWSGSDSKNKDTLRYSKATSFYIYPYSSGYKRTSAKFYVTVSEEKEGKYFRGHVNREITVEELFGNPFPVGDLTKQLASVRRSAIVSETYLPQPSELRIEIVLEDQAEVQEPLNIVLEEQTLTLKF